MADAVLVAGWPARRQELVALAVADSASHRRRAFAAQLTAEVAGYFGDAETCAAMIARAADAGTFDLPWLDRCPLLEAARRAPGSPRRARSSPAAPT